MGSTKINKGGKGKKGGGGPHDGDIVSVDLDKQTAVNLFLALAAALHIPSGKKKGKKGKKGKNGKNGTKGSKGTKGTKGTKGAKGSKGAKGGT